MSKALTTFMRGSRSTHRSNPVAGSFRETTSEPGTGVARHSDSTVRHMGPMAQDFHASFGLGDTDRAYDPIDAHGVTFAAIQGLYVLVQEQQAQIAQLEREDAKARCGE
jgi:hypothetical protein